MIITQKINWFPGHMKKATDEITKIINHIDLVIEVVDSRAIISSSNPDIVRLIKNKPHLKIALKSDLSDNIKQEENLFLQGSIKNKLFRKNIIDKLEDIIKDKKGKLIKKGLKNPKFLVLIVGLPNVGKSSLINFLKQKNILSAMNLPGVTKKQHIASINNTFDLVDTPGILIKNINDINVAYNLSLIHCIKKEVIDLEKVLEYGFNILNKNYQGCLFSYYKINKYISFSDFCNEIALKYGYLQKNNEIDLNRLYERLFKDISLSKITKINFEK